MITRNTGFRWVPGTLAMCFLAGLSTLPAESQTYTYLRSFGSDLARADSPYGLAFSPSNQLYVTDSASQVQVYTDSGTYVKTIGGFSVPVDVTFDKTGNLYVSNYSLQRIDKFNSSGNFVSTVVSGLQYPYGVAVNTGGDIYAAYGINQIAKFSSSGALLKTVTGSGVNQIVLDAAGNLYVSERGLGSIVKYGSDLNQLASFGGGGISQAYGVAVDAHGNVYATASGAGVINEYNSSGTFLQSIGAGELSTPYGIAFDSAGNLFVANSGTHSIVEFATDQPITGTPEPGMWSLLAGFGITAAAGRKRFRKSR
jgi:streptogramin lyase